MNDDAPQDGSAAEPIAHPVLLYDGVCGLCNRMVYFVLQRDPGAVFRFAALQSELARSILARHGANASDLDTVYVVVNYERPDESLWSRSDAVILVLRHLGAAELRAAGQPGAAVPTQTTSTVGSSFWPLAGRVLQFVPQSLRDWGYRMVARNRYRLFGRYDTCPVPTEDSRCRFLA
ncbi:MAG TPA: DCC1-like thiol-disulfide oxidoreductase family protein [Candidatus Sulfotelmatobacter sp.]